MGGVRETCKADGDCCGEMSQASDWKQNAERGGELGGDNGGAEDRAPANKICMRWW